MKPNASCAASAAVVSVAPAVVGIWTRAKSSPLREMKRGTAVTSEAAMEEAVRLLTSGGTAVSAHPAPSAASTSVSPSA